MNKLYGAIALAALAVCTASAFLLVAGTVTESGYKGLLFGASMVYFIAATLWRARKA